VSFNAGIVPPPPDLMPALLGAVEDDATPEQRLAFAQAWQDRVRRIFEQADHPDLVRCV
jgi:hypothetical protein